MWSLDKLPCVWLINSSFVLGAFVIINFNPCFYDDNLDLCCLSAAQRVEIVLIENDLLQQVFNLYIVACRELYELDNMKVEAFAVMSKLIASCV